MAVSANSRVLSSPHELPRASNTTKALAAHVAALNWQKRSSYLLPNVWVSADASTWFWDCYLGIVHHNVWYSQVSVSRAAYQYTMWILKKCESHLEEWSIFTSRLRLLNLEKHIVTPTIYDVQKFLLFWASNYFMTTETIISHLGFNLETNINEKDTMYQDVFNVNLASAKTYTKRFKECRLHNRTVCNVLKLKLIFIFKKNSYKCKKLEVIWVPWWNWINVQG